jgi:hypothetical protein
LHLLLPAFHFLAGYDVDTAALKLAFQDLKDLVVFIEEARAWANLPIVENLQICEENDWGRFYQLRAKSEKEFRKRPENPPLPETGGEPSANRTAQGDSTTSTKRKKR